MATPHRNGAVRSVLGAGTLSSRLPRSVCLSTPLFSSGSSTAFALTSKKRLFDENTLRLIVALLCHAAAQIEAAALQEVMADPVASEFIMTGVGRAEDQSATSPSATAPVVSSSFGNGKPSPPSSASSSESVAGGVANASTAPTKPSSPVGSPLQHGCLSPPSSEPPPQPLPSMARTLVEQAICAASAAVKGPSYSYSFPEAWFCPSAEAAAAHAGQNSAMRNPNSSPPGASAATAKGFGPLWQVLAPSSKFIQTNSTLAAADSHSPSSSTVVFLPPPSRVSNPDAAMRRNFFFSHAVPKVSVAVTAQPPLFFDNMLFDSATDRYLFDGHAFREEARVLQVPAADASSLEVCPVGNTEEENHATGHTHNPLLPSLVLVREYIPLSASGGDLGDEQGQLGVRESGSTAVVVQCVSLLPPQLTSIRPNPYHFLPTTSVTQYLLVAAPGCVTLVTPLHIFLYDKGSSLLTAAGSSLRRFWITPQGVANEACGPRGAETLSPTTTVGLSASASRASISPPNISLSAADKDRETARVALIEQRLAQNVLPDVLDEALNAIKSTLMMYCIQYDRRRYMRASIHAVRVLQRFFRRCLEVKRRAVRRMIQIWRQLEVDARLKLQQYRSLPTAVVQMDTVANNILQEHMLTSVGYKRAFIEDQWELRRDAFAKWKEEEEWADVLLSADWSKEDSSDVSVSDSPAEKRPRSARLSVSEQLRLDSEFRRRSSSKRLALKCALPRPSSSTDEVYTERERAAIRRFRSWYIDPQELLYLSHQRLLETLKGSVFRMEEVQVELKRATSETIKSDSNPLLTSFSSAHHAQQRR
ncbi:hypothetical protein JKF63_02106 [Porcisia hertigi]|uniref:Uncharacterized protein n=1 Tax=Porcisia hertigi TaxID=2761500 RepID=A0A836LCD6_9TRYP|nr:hypothetical protein JKF63_02106 [Porcisia hertigi]